jgi:hypothetical protein
MLFIVLSQHGSTASCVCDGRTDGSRSGPSNAPVVDGSMLLLSSDDAKCFHFTNALADESVLPWCCAIFIIILLLFASRGWFHCFSLGLVIKQLDRRGQRYCFQLFRQDYRPIQKMRLFDL